MRMPFPLPNTLDTEAPLLHPRDPQPCPIRPSQGARLVENPVGQQIGMAGGVEQLNQQHLGHTVALTQSSEATLPGPDGIEEHLEGEDSAVKDLEDVEVKDLVDLNLNLDPEDGTTQRRRLIFRLTMLFMFYSSALITNFIFGKSVCQMTKHFQLQDKIIIRGILWHFSICQVQRRAIFTHALRFRHCVDLCIHTYCSQQESPAVCPSDPRCKEKVFRVNKGVFPMSQSTQHNIRRFRS